MKTPVIKVNPDFPETDKIAQCGAVIRKGGLVIFPTETVYGIAADFNNPSAMNRLRDVKKRPPDKPFSILIAQKGHLSNYTSRCDTAIYKVVDHFWPGPLTVIVPAKEEGRTIGVRMPAHSVALRLIQESQCCLAAPSANLEGQPAPRTCSEALKDLDGLVDMAIDGGPAQYGQSSTVADFTQARPGILREGFIPKEDIEKVMNMKIILFVCTGNSCRSVMAEYLLKKMLRDRRDIEILSAGTAVFVRTPASAETIHVLSREGLDASRHLSQPITDMLLRKADLILVMTGTHRQQILEKVPSVESRVYLLREFASYSGAGGKDMDVPDPIAKPAEAYEECLLTIKDALNKIVRLI
ncbi:MAG: L-threonylcarbamoyladenylate synthase [Candidatus Omnitrophota bacterium]